MALDKVSIGLNKGLFKESRTISAPEGTYSFALNANLGSLEGDAGTFTNENSNEICITLPEGDFTVIGAVLLTDDNEVIFYTDNTDSYIGLHDTRACTITTLVRSTCLDFKKYRQIRALSKIVKACERVILFTDRVGPYRNINIDNLEQYLNAGETVTSANADGLG